MAKFRKSSDKPTSVRLSDFSPTSSGWKLLSTDSFGIDWFEGDQLPNILATEISQYFDEELDDNVDDEKLQEDMLMCFDSPLNLPKVAPRTLGMKSPLIPCPTLLPFDIGADTAAFEGDPFENVSRAALHQTPLKAKAVSLPGSPTSPKHMRGLPQDSELDISAALTGRCLVSSTPNPVGLSRDKDLPALSLVYSPPGTPTRRQLSARQGSLANTPRRSVINKVMEMSADHLRMIVQKKMEKLRALNQNLPSAGYFTLRRSLSTSDLPRGLRQPTYPGATDSSNSSREDGANEITYNKLAMSLVNESARSQEDRTSDLTPIKVSSVKKEAIKLSSIFQNITVDLGNGPESPNDLRLERPPWEWSGSSSEDEDGLPKIVRLRVSAKKELNQSPDTASLVNRYRKARNSLQFDDNKESEVQASSQSQPSNQADSSGTGDIIVKATEPVRAAQETTTAPAVIPQCPIPEIVISDLKSKTATTNILKKGPLKAMMPLPSMMKAVMPPCSKVPNSRSNSVSSAPLSSIQAPRGRDKAMLGSFRRSSSSSALMRQQLKPSSPKQKLTPKKIVERPTTAPSQSQSSEPLAKGKGTLLKKRISAPTGKENLVKK